MGFLLAASIALLATLAMALVYAFFEWLVDRDRPGVATLFLFFILLFAISSLAIYGS